MIFVIYLPLICKFVLQRIHTSPPILADPLREPPEHDEAVSEACPPLGLLLLSPALSTSGAGLVTMTGATATGLLELRSLSSPSSFAKP